MMWICRAGKNGQNINDFKDASRIFLTWEGYRQSMSSFTNNQQYRDYVSNEKKTTNKTSISNWAGQLIAFHEKMMIGDYVMIPYFGSRTFLLAKVVGDYEFDKKFLYPHTRLVEFLLDGIPASIFSEEIWYSLRAYRTIYKVRNEKNVLEKIKEWSEENGDIKLR